MTDTTNSQGEADPAGAESQSDTAAGTAGDAFAALGLAEPLLRVLAELGYEAPTPIQAKTIPTLIAKRDMIGQAQTGTGKTAAFALPMLQAIDIANTSVQALVLAPTRELALQVSEAIHKYSKHLGRVS